MPTSLSTSVSRFLGKHGNRIRSIYLTFELIDSHASYIPGHIHAFYLEYVYYDRREQANHNRFATGRAPGIYSDRVQTGGRGYGTMVPPTGTS